MKYILIIFVLLCAVNLVKNIMKTPAEREMERLESQANRYQEIHNANRAIASESTCDALQEARNPEMCSEMAEERTKELDKRSENYWR